MPRVLFALTFAVFILSGQTPVTKSLAESLSFETEHPGGLLNDWGGGPPGTIFADDQVVHSGHWSARIERTAESPNGFSTFSKSIPIDFAGKTVQLQGYLRTADVSGFTGLWMREDGDSPSLAFDNMQNQQLKGTTDWKEYVITLPVHPDARKLIFGVLSAGTGKAWVDDLQLLVDGKPIWEAPHFERPLTGLDRDHEFDAGSRLAIQELTQTQIENLATLCKVWGFLKYHHHAITEGSRHWDYDLFRIMPAVLAAPNRAEANTAILQWTKGLNPSPICSACVPVKESDIHLRPPLEWIDDKVMLGKELSEHLSLIRTNRVASNKQFYVSQVPTVSNPVFEHELRYANVRFPDAGFQTLALFRFWNIIEYWFPYRDVMGEHWDKLLTEFIPRIALAKDADAYQRELLALIVKVHDSHANLWSSLRVRPPVGACRLPIVVRFIENRPIITQFERAAAPSETGFRMGDEITDLDGAPVSNLVKDWLPYYAGSNEPTRLRDLAKFMTQGECVESAIRVRRGAETVDLKQVRLPIDSRSISGLTHDLPGDTFRLLSPELAYLKLSSVKVAEAPHYIKAAEGTKGLIIDLRNYPSEFVVFALGSLLVSKETEFVRFTSGDLAYPGAFHWQKVLSIKPEKPHYAGKVMVLVDEVTQSQAEYTAMAFRAAQAKIIGSTTAGADGNVSPIPLPGGLSTLISGIGVFYPDKKPTQRIGIVPDIEVKPTIAGIRAGRDEVLEEAIRQILGPVAGAALIEKGYRQPPPRSPSNLLFY